MGVISDRMCHIHAFVEQGRLIQVPRRGVWGGLLYTACFRDRSRAQKSGGITKNTAAASNRGRDVEKWRPAAFCCKGKEGFAEECAIRIDQEVLLSGIFIEQMPQVSPSWRVITPLSSRTCEGLEIQLGAAIGSLASKQWHMSMVYLCGDN